MATTNRPLHEEIRQHNSALDRILRARYGMSFRTFKVIKAITQLVGVVAGVYAMSLGADPMTALALIALIYAGPEAAEIILMQGSESTTTDVSDD
jgi:predicted branched-subunit amino acid permease